MEKDKSRGLKHIKDKKKYKDNSTKNPKHVPAKTAPRLKSNWDRYEEEPQNTEAERKLTDSTDFRKLANAPISIGARFQFKSDKIQLEEVSAQKLFDLDLEMLGKSLATIPFYERLGLEMEYYTESDIKQMDQVAAKNLEEYKAYLGNVKNDESLDEIVADSIKEADDDDDDDLLMELLRDCSMDKMQPATSNKDDFCSEDFTI